MRCDYLLLLYLTAKIAVSCKSTHVMKSRLSYCQSYGGKLHGSQEIASLVLHPFEEAGKEQILPISVEQGGVKKNKAVACGNYITQKTVK